MSREIGGMLVAGGLAGAAIGGVLNETRHITRGISSAIRAAVQTGDQGWDVDGKFVCSSFVFDFNTEEFHDGLRTRSFWKLKSASTYGDTVVLTFHDDPREWQYWVGSVQRATMIYRILHCLEQGTPRGKKLLPTYMKRMRRLTLTRLIRYALRGVIVGGLLMFLFGITMQTSGAWPASAAVEKTMELYPFFAGGVFALSIAYRKLRSVARPLWSFT